MLIYFKTTFGENLYMKPQKEINVVNELENFRKYLRGENSEKAKQHLLYPLFHKLFKDKFKIENDARGADIYIEGQLLVESKSGYSQWLDGFYQALHYQKKWGLSYNTILVVANRFVGVWKVNKLPKEAFLLHHKADVHKAPNVIGKENAKVTSQSLKKEIQNSAVYWLEPEDLKGDIFKDAKSITSESYEIKKILNNLDSDRLQINRHNFINTIERMKPFFENPIDAIHCFYTIVAYWDITSVVTERPNEKVSVSGFKGHKGSDDINIQPRKISEFKKFIESQYVFTNEGSGRTADYYFSRFDEVLATIQPEYVKQHGIFFTDDNLSKFALWFVKNNFAKDVHEKYIVFDPAGGSGNLISSWRDKLKHKIISELQPDLLKTIESRMKIDPFHVETGFTIVPKTIENKGLNFIDCSAESYLNELEEAVWHSSHISIDKPIAFLLNPPYKSTDENSKERDSLEANYKVHESIMAITGQDAGKERYISFLGQILNISKEQATKNEKLHPIVLVFTPTSWLFPKQTYVPFRNIWDKHFKFHSGFIVTSNEWFKLSGKWGVTFTIWTYNENENKHINKIKLLDLTHLKKDDLDLEWEKRNSINAEVKKAIRGAKKITLDNSRGSIKDWVGQKMYDFKRDATQKEMESGEVFGGLPLKDKRRGNKKTYGISNSEFIGFMDDVTPVRLKSRDDARFSKKQEFAWFRIDSGFIDLNKSKCFNGAPDQKGYCAYNLDSAKKIFTWFTITKALNGVYPIWANQNEIWKPNIIRKYENYWHSLCFAFVLAENRCVVTKFEENNPVKDAPEIFVNNPLCPTNKESFWTKVLDKQIISKPSAAKDLVDVIKLLYKNWNLKYCKGQTIYSVGLHDEPYFRYFNYRDFLTPYSGLIQIRKYAELNSDQYLLDQFKEISERTKKVKSELHRLLIDEFKYFE